MAISYGGDNVTFGDGSTLASGRMGMVNRIINGDMRIDQRNAGASINNNNTGTQYSLDRWAVYGDQNSKYTVQQNAASVTSPVGFSNYAGITSSSAYTVGSSEQFKFYQPVEGYNMADLNWGSANAKTVTLSFWVRSSLTGTFGGSIVNGSANRSYVFSYTISSANTWEQKSITIAGDTSGTWGITNGVGAYVQLGLGVGSTLSNTAGSWYAGYYVAPTGATSVVGTNGATFYITGVDLRPGTYASAPTWEFRSYGQELQLCQRYCYAINNSGSSNGGILGTHWATGNVYIIVPLPVSMRTYPSATFSAASTFTYYYSSTTGTPNSISLGNVQLNSAEVSVGITGSPLNAGYSGWLRPNSTSSQLLFSAEL